MTPDIKKNSVELVPENSLLGKFQIERTDAIMEMFDNKYDNGIYPTSQFFFRLDKCVKEILEAQRKEIVGRLEGMKRPMKKPSGKPLSVFDEHQAFAYNQSLNDVINALNNDKI